MRNSSRFTALFLTAAAFGLPLAAKEKKKDKADPPQDQIRVESHIAVPGGPITQFAATTHYNRSYVSQSAAPANPSRFWMSLIRHTRKFCRR